MIGVVQTPQGLQMAKDAGLDLVEVSPSADPPVCKILDYGKYKFEEQKKKSAIKKKQKIIEIKEIKIRPMIDSHDLQVKINTMIRFFEEGDRVRVTMRFRGREMDHQEIGREVLKKICESTQELAKVEQMPKLEGKQMIMLLSSKSQ